MRNDLNSYILTYVINRQKRLIKAIAPTPQRAIERFKNKYPQAIVVKVQLDKSKLPKELNEECLIEWADPAFISLIID